MFSIGIAREHASPTHLGERELLVGNQLNGSRVYISAPIKVFRFNLLESSVLQPYWRIGSTVSLVNSLPLPVIVIAYDTEPKTSRIDILISDDLAS
jgi:hypothetical protein